MTADFQPILEDLKSNLISELATIATHDSQTDDWVAVPSGTINQNADENEHADSIEEWNERRALVAQLELRYHSMQLALQKITNGTFGYCEICNEAIELERLQVNPASRTCKAHLERERELPL